MVGGDGCKLPLLQSLACDISSDTNEMLVRARALGKINEETVGPLLRCDLATCDLAACYLLLATYCFTRPAWG